MKKIFTFFLSTLVSSFLFGQDCPSSVNIDGPGRLLFRYADEATKNTNYSELETNNAVTITGDVGNTPIATGALSKGSGGVVGGGNNPYFRTSLGYADSEPNGSPFTGTVSLNFQAPTADKACEYDANGLLPVLYASFNAKKQVKTVLLSWTTVSEINNDYFVIERSKDSKNYTEIGEIKGVGNSDEFVDYHFTDENPAEGANYYRLRQVDFDGTENMSVVKVVQINNNGTTTLTVYPTLTKDNVTVDLINYNKTELNAEITSVSGSFVRSFTLSGGTKPSVNVADLAPGIYLMSVQSNNGIATGKFVVK